jgi:hypothetical protein
MKKKQILARNRHTQMVNSHADTHELGRVLEKEREEEMREASMASARAAERTSSGEKTVWSAKVQMIRNKNTGRARAADSKWNRFAGTEGGGGRGL